MKVAIYPGSFNPFHQGHYDILMQSLELFDKVIVAIGLNVRKTTRGFKNADDSELLVARYLRLNKQLAKFIGVGVDKYDGLLTDVVQLNQATHIIRGLRSGYDVEYEINLRKTIGDINPEIQFVYFVPSNPKFYHISSSMIRELAQYDRKAAEKYIFHPEHIGQDEDLILR